MHAFVIAPDLIISFPLVLGDNELFQKCNLFIALRIQHQALVDVVAIKRVALVLGVLAELLRDIEEKLRVIWVVYLRAECVSFWGEATLAWQCKGCCP